jgi:hypothetical protein
MGQFQFPQCWRQELAGVTEAGSEHPFGLEYAVMKPCVCNGRNDNCRYCSGSGYVSDETFLPVQGHPPHNPYVNMKPSLPQKLDPKIEDEIVRQLLLHQEEENRKRQAWKEESRKRALVGAALLLTILFLTWLSRR